MNRKKAFDCSYGNIYGSSSIAQTLQQEDEDKSMTNSTTKSAELRRLYENSPELQELERSLMLAYINKERASQILEKKIENERRKQEIEEEKLFLMEEAKRFELKEQQENELKFISKIKYQKDLNLQVEHQNYLQQVAFNQFLHEKKIIDEIIEKVKVEEEEKRLAHFQKLNLEKKLIQDFIDSQLKWKELEKERISAENSRIETFLQSKQKREDDWKAKKAKWNNEKSSIVMELANKIVQEENVKKERENILQELHYEENLKRQEEKERVEMEIKILKKLELNHIYLLQMEEMQKKLEIERQKEEELAKRLSEKYAEDEKIDQMNAQKRRMKLIEHKRDIEKLIVEQEKQREKRIIEEKLYWEAHNREEERRRNLIEDERQRLLKLHAPQLMEFLPPSVLRSMKDIDFLT